jgi:hypothetical protein
MMSTRRFATSGRTAYAGLIVKRSSVLSAVALACAVFDPSVAMAEKAKPGKTDAVAAEGSGDSRAEIATIDMNSKKCGFTLFTDNSDRIDFTGSRAGSCFDLMDGDDSLVLDRDYYANGVHVYTGKGRDDVVTTDRADRVVDEGGEDAAIVTLGGDDVIELHLPVDDDPFRGAKMTQRTEIWPGPGSNTVRIGTNLYSNAFARYSPNAWLWMSPGASDQVSMDCGRPQDEETYDLRVMEVPETSALTLTSTGCGVGIFGQFGKLNIDQVGGRLALKTEGEKFRAKAGDGLPLIAGTIKAGTTAVIDLTASHPQSDLTWQGRQDAVVRGLVEDELSGGSYRVVSREGILFEGRPGPAQMEWSLMSEGRIEMDLVGYANVTAEQFRLAAPYVDIKWSFEGGAGFPSISTVEQMKATVWAAEPRHIEFYQGTLAEKAQAMLSRAMSIVKGEEVEEMNANLPEEVAPLDIVPQEREFDAGTVVLSLKLRSAGDREAACFRVEVVDADGAMPTLKGECVDIDAAPATLSTLDAKGYDEIRLSGPTERVILINDASDLRVDRLSIQY